jgi:formylglycine-generating enzyme required for sulfatase activity
MNSATRRLCRRVAGAGRGDRVLRGGSWNNNQNNARCAYRNRNNPNNRNNNNGFRLVSHIFCPAGNATGRRVTE